MDHEEFDLFGDPVRLPNGRRGRPAHKATQENRNKVMMLLAAGWSNERIAAALHVTQPTLRKHYFSELKARAVQRDRLDAHRLMLALTEANNGNVGAMRLFDQLLAKNDAALISGQLGDAQRKAAAKSQEPGKKEREKLDAHRAIDDSSGDWEDDLNPGSGMH